MLIYQYPILHQNTSTPVSCSEPTIAYDNFYAVPITILTRHFCRTIQAVPVGTAVGGGSAVTIIISNLTVWWRRQLVTIFCNQKQSDYLFDYVCTSENF